MVPLVLGGDSTDQSLKSASSLSCFSLKVSNDVGSVGYVVESVEGSAGYCSRHDPECKSLDSFQSCRANLGVVGPDPNAGAVREDRSDYSSVNPFASFGIESPRGAYYLLALHRR
jgi:hypothetical protein